MLGERGAQATGEEAPSPESVCASRPESSFLGDEIGRTGPMGGLPPTGKKFTVVNIVIQRLEDGRIAETWVSWDNVAMLTQLGLLPPPAPGPEAG